MLSPTCPSIPPSASTACPPTMTQCTRAIIANTAASLIAVVCAVYPGHKASFSEWRRPSRRASSAEVDADDAKMHKTRGKHGGHG